MTDLVAELEKTTLEAMALDAPLDERLGLVRDRVRALSSVFATAVDGMVERLNRQAAGDSAPAVGERLPPFVLPDERGRLVSLEQLIEKGPAAICFVRGHWCPYCRLNAAGLHEIEGTIAGLGARLAVILPETREFAAMLKTESGAAFPVLSDIDNGYALSLNLAIYVGEEMSRLIGGAGWDVPRYNGNESWMMPMPAAFIVREDGVISARHIDPDYRRRMDLNALVEAVAEARGSIPLRRAQ